jgi:hypothetical protein
VILFNNLYEGVRDRSVEASEKNLMGDTVDSLSDRLNSFIQGPKQPEPPPIYKPRQFDEAEPMKPQRMPPVSPAQAVNFNDYKGKPNDTYWYNEALKKARTQYDKESGPYQAEKDKYDAAMEGWRGRKKVWDDAENQLVENSKEPYNKVSQYLADPKGKEQLNWNNGALVLPYVGTALGGTYLNNMARGPWSKIGLGGLELAAGHLLRNSVAATQPSKYEDPDAHYQNQMWQNALEGTGAGMATSSIRAALMKGKDAQAENKPDEPSQKPLLDLSGRKPKEASEDVLRALNAKPGRTLAENKDLIREAVKNADPKTLDALAASHSDFDRAKLADSIIARQAFSARASPILRSFSA